MALGYRDLSTAVAGFAWAFDDDMTRIEADAIWPPLDMEKVTAGRASGSRSSLGWQTASQNTTVMRYSAF